MGNLLRQHDVPAEALIEANCGATGDDSAEVAEFCRAQGITEQLALAVMLAKSCFGPGEVTCELAQDYDTDDRWIVVRLSARGSVPDVLAARKQYTARWVAAVPAPQRHLVRLSYSIA